MSVDETLVCDHSNENYWEVLSWALSSLFLNILEKKFYASFMKYWALALLEEVVYFKQQDSRDAWLS